MMKGERYIIGSENLIFSDSSFYFEKNSEKSFPKSLEQRMINIVDFADLGWQRKKDDINIYTKKINLNEELVKKTDDFIETFNTKPFYTIDDFEGGKGGFISTAAIFTIEFIASYLAGKTLDQILNKLKNKETIIKWEEIEKIIGEKGEIKIYLGKSNYTNNRTLIIKNISKSLKNIDEKTIEKIYETIKETNDNLIYDEKGLKIENPFKGDNIDVLI